MQEVMIFSTVLAPVILALVEVAKRSVEFPKKHVPLVAVVLGIIVGVTTGEFTSLEWGSRIWAGIIAGVSSTGLFEIGKNRVGYTKGGNK